MVNALVIRAVGTNCDNETVYALSRAGFEVQNLHLNEVLESRKVLQESMLLVLPGGFSYGDYLGSAKVFANQLRFKLKSELDEFIDGKKMVLGICNGFQALVKAGILPAIDERWKQEATLTLNESGHFQDEWVTLENASKNNTPFLLGITGFDCPINHGEGRFFAEKEILEKLYQNNQVVLKYKNNPNGSLDSIAGISSKDGLVLGLMPHPEKHVFSINHPQSTRKEFGEVGAGLKIFQNAFEYWKK